MELGLGFAGSRDPIDGVEPDGTVRTKPIEDGAIQRFRRDGDGLVYRLGRGRRPR